MDFEPDDDEYVADWRERASQCASLQQSREQNFCHPSCHGGEEKFQLDSGSTVNLMSDKTVERLCGIDCLNDLEKKIFDSGHAN